MTVTLKYKIVNNNDIYWLNEISCVWKELAGVTARNKNKNASSNVFRPRYSESLQRNLARLDHKVFDVRIIVAYNCRAAKYSSATANLPANWLIGGDNSIKRQEIQ